MPPVRVLLIDDLVMRAETIAFALSAYPDIVVVGRLRVHDPQLAQRAAAAPADVAAVALIDTRDTEADAGPADGESGVDRDDAAAQRLLPQITDDLLGSRPGMRLIALVDPQNAALISAIERLPQWSFLSPDSPLDELAAAVRASANASG